MLSGDIEPIFSGSEKCGRILRRLELLEKETYDWIDYFESTDPINIGYNNYRIPFYDQWIEGKEIDMTQFI